jgi:hypothetical protein
MLVGVRRRLQCGRPRQEDGAPILQVEHRWNSPCLAGRPEQPAIAARRDEGWCKLHLDAPDAKGTKRCKLFSEHAHRTRWLGHPDHPRLGQLSTSIRRPRRVVHANFRCRIALRVEPTRPDEEVIAYLRDRAIGFIADWQRRVSNADGEPSRSFAQAALRSNRAGRTAAKGG